MKYFADFVFTRKKCSICDLLLKVHNESIDIEMPVKI